MGLLDKVKPKSSGDEVTLTADELTFILTKLRTAEYKGVEFETFYNVYSKIQNRLDKIKE